MSTTHRFVLAATTALALVLGTFTAAGEPATMPMNMHNEMQGDMHNMSQSVSDHMVMAQRFEAEALQFDREAAEHEAMARNYRAGASPKGNFAALARHCQRIAKNLRGAAANAREMAQMHRAEAHGNAQ